MPAPSRVTTITDRGQVSIPADLRRQLALRKGHRLVWERVGDRELRLLVLDEARPSGARAMLGFARTFRSEPRSTEAWLQELREGEEP